MLAGVCVDGEVAGRAVVVQMTERAPTDGERLATYVLALTVMTDDEPPFRCRITAALPAADQWNVRVGSHVPVTITPPRDVALDTAALRALYELG